ncbi:MAG: HIT domain-containing protein [Candidatus Aenigmatarchaeota archaeon]
MNDCIFCKIAKKEIPSFIVYEDEECVGFLDVMPRSKGMCIVVPKKHYLSFDEDFDTSSKVFSSALIVAEKIKEALNPITIFFSSIFSQIPHFHVRVYPVYNDQIPLIENKPLEVEESELSDLSRKIRSIEVDWKPQEKIVEIIKEVVVEKKVEPEKKEKTEEDKKEDKFWKRKFEVA